eukprot:1153044-Pyramimonas_sp.AAC.1
MAEQSPTQSETIAWVDTLKTAVLSPFVLLKEYGMVGDCHADVLTVVCRRALTYAWHETCPPLDKVKKWGVLRKLLIQYIFHRHPQYFSNSSLQDLRISNAS